MADKVKSKLRYDDFVSNVQPDPAKPESTIMLSGFVGRGPEGHARIYPDPSLGTWYDIPEADIIHSMPIADAKLGGSYVWARASAQIKPGSAAPAATEAPQQAPQAGAAALQPTPATHCFVCDPLKAAVFSFAPGVCPGIQTLHCTMLFCDTLMAAGARAAPQQANAGQTGVTVCVTDCVPPGNQMMKAAIGNPMDPTPQSRCFVCDPPNMLAAMQPTPTVQTHCFICPPLTQQVNCPPHQTPFCTIPPNCPAQTQLVPCPTQPGACTLPVQCYQNTWFGCQQGGGQQHPAAMAAAAPAFTIGCTAQTCPPSLVCPTPVGTCPTVITLCWNAPSAFCAQAPNGVFTPFGR